MNPALASATGVDDAATPKSLDELVALAREKRDLKLADDIRRYVRPVSIEPGRLRIGLAEGAPADFTRQLAAKLQALTGRRWLVLKEDDARAPTLAERERARQDTLMQQAQEDAAVRAVLERFPEARILKVRPVAETTTMNGNDEDAP
jgi:DNA polymerase-3 subunit gamma/tau